MAESATTAAVAAGGQLEYQTIAGAEMVRAVRAEDKKVQALVARRGSGKF
jgi:hypothetical protein